jgi:PAS domain S-box-containing protein
VATHSPKNVSRTIRLGVWLLLLAGCWTILIFVLAAWDYRESYASATTTAHMLALNEFNKDLIFRKWASSHGGVYVTPDEKTPPNPYLASIPDRDIALPLGKKLTLMNPAYMTRQVHEMQNDNQDVIGHITSLKPLRPENTPDPWEKKSLLAFEQGTKETYSLERIGKETYLRMMRPMLVEQGCLKCHEGQGYKLGDVRGGISISVPWAPFQEALNAKLSAILFRYGGIWTVGIVGLYVFQNRLNSYLANLKQTENALRESESLQRTLMDNLPAGVVIIDPATHAIESMNPYASLIFGAPANEIVGRRCQGFLCSAHQGECPICDLGHVVDNSETMMVREDDSNIPILKSVTKFKFNDHVKLLETFVDISESKKTEKLLKQTRLNYETFFNCINDFLFVLDRQGNILHTNAAVTNRLGYSVEELTGKSVLTVFSHEHLEEVERLLGDILEGEADLCMAPLGTKSGEEIPVETSFSKGFWDGMSVLFGVCKDITQVKRSEEKFSKSFHLNSVIMALSNLEDGTILDANETFTKALGYSRDEIIGNSVTSFKLYAMPEQRQKIVEILKQDGSVKEAEVAIRVKDGTIKDCLISANAVRIGNKPCMLSSVVDVTHRKELERRQNLMAEILSILNTPTVMSESLAKVLDAIQQATDYDAVGIRLRNGEDYPYFVQIGFRHEFLSAENSLLSFDDRTGICRDQEGNAITECTCGLVISGQCEKKEPNFTAGGSFWTNDLPAFLNLPEEADPRTHPRNRCILEGFSSMALVPIRENNEIVGLLQLNDRRRDCFTYDKIQFFEGIGESIGVSLVRKRMEDALRESEDKFRRHVENSFDVIFTLEKTGTFSFLSPAWERHFGYSVAESVGKQFQPFLHPDDVASYVEYFLRVLNTGQSETSPSIRIKCSDGSYRWFETNGTRYIDAQGEVQFIGVGHDTTERMQAEEKLRNYAAVLESNNRALEEFNRLAEEATRAKGEFLANMSHEIRTPMTAILGCADLLINEKGLERAPPQRRRNIETIKRNGEHLLGLLNDILDLSKMEAGKMKIVADTCSPFQLIEEVVSLMRVRAEEKELSLVADLDEPLPETIRTDPLRLRQVLINLTGNAIKFTDNGSIRIAARLTKDNGSPHLRFDVSDTGIGMNEEQVGNLFRAFSQVDNSAARKFGGTGLGLCICKRLAEAMGGNIEVQSTPGKGSTFSFTIDPGPLEGIRMIHPSQQPENLPAASPAANAEIKLNCRVLLAEDGPDNQRLIRIILEEAGASVTTVENGQLAVASALEAIEKVIPYDIILMDMQMPVMDGYTATRELRSHGYTAPIIALTAHAMADDRQKCLDAGCNDFVVKPFDWQKLLATIDHWSDRLSTCKKASREEEVQAPPPNKPEDTLESIFADKPVIVRVLPEFINGLETRLQALNDSLAAGNFEELRRIAHQLKGAGGSYGYPSITAAATALEFHAREQREEDAKASLARVAAQCRAAINGFKRSMNHVPETTST